MIQSDGMTQKYVIGNWKLNPATVDEARSLAASLHHQSQCVVGCAPSFVHTSIVKAALKDNVLLGAQDIAYKTGNTGAFTGDISAAQVTDLGASFVLVGHSERRQYHHESDDVFYQKMTHAFASGLSVIYCIGETKTQYDQGATHQVLESQLQVLENFASELPLVHDTAKGQLPKLVIAYEPVWAIGTGLTPTFEEIEHTHNFISETLSTLQIPAPILYGGSVNDKNAISFAQSPLIDGALVGGASLKAESFLAIVEAFAR